MTTPRWLTDEEQALWRLLLDTSRQAQRCMEEQLQSVHDLSYSEFSVLVSLSEAPGTEIRLRDLCLALTWDRSRTSHQITRMERRGLVTKCKCSGDARGVVVELTDEGRRRLDAAAPQHVELVRRMIFDRLAADDIPALRRFCEKVLEVTGASRLSEYPPKQ